jgi:hypothetical protein
MYWRLDLPYYLQGRRPARAEAPILTSSPHEDGERKLAQQLG